MLHFFHARAQASTKSAAGGGPESTDLKTLAVSFILPAGDETKLRRLAEQGQVSLSSSKAYIPLPEDAETFPDPGFAPLVIIVGALVLGVHLFFVQFTTVGGPRPGAGLRAIDFVTT